MTAMPSKLCAFRLNYLIKITLDSQINFKV